MNELAHHQVKITDSFWSPRLAVNARQAIFHQWRELEKSGCLANFSFLTGDKDGFREGWFFADSDVYKWLDAAARIYASAPDEPLKALMNECIELFARAQTPDGYLFTYNQLHSTLRAEYDEQRLGGVEVLRAETVDRRLLTFIPYPL